ncbi:MAG: cobyric acid synthase CobQ, partial [Acidaminococcaceae bacterium]|nr:cobyric acid synthase CobQ [Acidaminococcaceae bacterium]
HSGVTNLEGGTALNMMQPINEPGELVPEGAQNMEGKHNVYGSYCHGIFDGDGIAITIVEALLAKKGMKMDDIKAFSFADYKKQQYDILADYVRSAVDMKQIYTIIEEGV